MGPAGSQSCDDFLSRVTAMFCSVVLTLNRLCCSLRKGKKVYALCKAFCFALLSERGIAHTENKQIVHITCLMR